MSQYLINSFSSYLSLLKNSLLVIVFVTLIFSIIYTVLEYLLEFKKEKKISKIYFFIKNFFKSLFFILIIILMFSSILSIYLSIKKINTIYNNYIKTRELKLVIKNLSENRRLAKIDIINNTEDLITFNLTLYSQDNNIVYSNRYELKGNELYFDFIIINFDYKFIENKEKFTIAIPYKIFSNKISFNEGINLLVKDKNKIPYILDYIKDKPYSLTIEQFRKNIEYLIKVTSDTNYAKQEGIRSYHGSAIHFVPSIDSTYIIRSEATGGLIVEKLDF